MGVPPSPHPRILTILAPALTFAIINCGSDSPTDENGGGGGDPSISVAIYLLGLLLAYRAGGRGRRPLAAPALAWRPSPPSPPGVAAPFPGGGGKRYTGVRAGGGCRRVVGDCGAAA